MANSLDIRLSIEFDELVTCSEAFLKCAVAFDQDEVIAEDFDGMKEGTVGNLESREMAW